MEEDEVKLVNGAIWLDIPEQYIENHEKVFSLFKICEERLRAQ